MDRPPSWQDLHELARGRINPRRISPLIEAGAVAAAVLTDRGNVYTGVCIDTACTLGMCAERNAVANMITNGESRIVKLVCTFEGRELWTPCGACREYLMQLDAQSGEMEVLLDLASLRTVRLRELLPGWWGEKLFREAR
jgi:cytidine deaminase